MVEEPHPIKVPWRVGDLVRPLLVTFILVLGTNLLLRFVDFEAYFLASPYQSLIAFGLFFVQEVFFLAPIFFFLRSYPISIETLGFRKVRFWKTVGLVLKGFGMLFIFGLFMFVVIGQKEIPGFSQQESYFPLFGFHTNFDVYIAFIVLVLLAPLIEEVAFRGFILQSTIQQWGYRIGNIFTAVLFAAIHLQFGSFFLLIIPSLILNWIFLKSRSLIPSLAFHILNNLLAFIVQWLYFTGKFPPQGLHL